MTDNKALELLALMSGLDESYINEAQSCDRIKLTRRVRKFPVMLSAVISVVVLSTVTAAAWIQGFISHKKNVEHNYQFVEDSTFVSELEKRQGQPIVAQNTHLRLTVDSVISDKICIECHATLEGLDEQGRLYISKYLSLTQSDFERSKEKNHSFVPFMKAQGADGKDKYFNQTADNQYGRKGDYAEGSFIFSARKEAFGNAEKITVVCYDWESVDRQQNKGLDDLNQGIFDGLSFELSLKPNYDTLILKAGEEKSAQYFYISDVRMYNEKGGWSTSDEIVINYKDGSSEKIDPEKMTDIRRFDIENIKSVKYQGAEYLPERIEQAATEQ